MKSIAIPSVVFALFLTTSATSAQQAFEVTNENSSGPGSLRHAVELANTNGNPGVVDTITFDSTVTHVIQSDLYAMGSVGPIHITQSVAILGHGSGGLTIDGQFAWINNSGYLNIGFPDSPTSIVTTVSGTLFEVGIYEQDNSAIHVTLSGMTVRGTNGVVTAQMNAQVTCAGLIIRNNATRPGSIPNSDALVSAAPGCQLYMTKCSIAENTVGEQSIISAFGVTRLYDCAVHSNNVGAPLNGPLFGGSVLEIVGCDIDVGTHGQLTTTAENTYIANSYIGKSTPGFTAVISAFHGLHLRNVTVLNSRILAGNPIGQPSHLSHALGVVSMANTVLGALIPPTLGEMYEPFMTMSDTTLLLNTHNHVDDGSLADAASGLALLDSHARPMTGSPLIDAGLDAQAINPLTGAVLTFDLNGSNRISGAYVDIGAHEVQQFYAINDAYTVGENMALGEAAPGVLANDTFDPPGTLKNNSISIVKEPDHGHLDADNLAGGFIYLPDPDFHGTDTFEYLAQFTNPIGLTKVATVTITVEPQDTAPVGHPDAYETVEGLMLVVGAPGVLGNDTDADNLPPAPPNAGLTATNPTQPSQGTVILAPDGSFSYVPGIPGTYVWTYETVDPQGAVSAAPGQVTITVHPTGTVLGQEGLSHGYWKNHLDAWHGTVDYLGDFGGIPILKAILPTQALSYHFFAATPYGLGGVTMEEALQFNRGSGATGAARVLLKQAVAALLNAAHPNVNYPLTIHEVIDDVDAALASGSRSTIINLAKLLDDYNNL
ncbi:MAG: hypothetical protein ACI8QZ_003050 [Chlamydiales bacterium]|jgi:hypothetical protein